MKCSLNISNFLEEISSLAYAIVFLYYLHCSIKKAFLSEQCKQVEENNRMGKTRDLFKKIGDIKGTFHARMGTIKDRNSKDIIKCYRDIIEEVKKR